MFLVLAKADLLLLSEPVAGSGAGVVELDDELSAPAGEAAVAKELVLFFPGSVTCVCLFYFQCSRVFCFLIHSVS